MQPETRYAKSGDLSIAFQVVGEAPLDVVLVPGWVSNLDFLWEEPSIARLLHRQAAYSRLILFEKRGTGLVDSAANPAPIKPAAASTTQQTTQKFDNFTNADLTQLPGPHKRGP